MPPNRTSAAGTKPFKPQRPSGVNKGVGKPSPSSRTASKPQSTTATASSRAKTTAQKSKSSSGAGRSRPEVEHLELEDPEEAEAEADADPFAAPPPATIPPELLTRLLHEFMAHAQQSEGGSGRNTMRISKGADKAVGKYMETFVREAIARAAFERAEAARSGGGGSGSVGMDGFLEVEDLEKLAPQLVLDF